MVFWIVFSLASALFFGLKDVLAKKFFRDKEVSPIQLVFEEYFVFLVVILAIFFVFVDFFSFFDLWLLYFFKGVSMFVATFFYFELLKKHPISHVSPMLNLSPFLLFFLSVLVLSDKVSFLQFLGMMIVLFSTFFLEITVHHHERADPHSHHFISLGKKDFIFYMFVFFVLAGFSFGALFDKLIFNEGVSVYTNLFFTSVFVFLFLLVYYIVEGRLGRAVLNVVREPETLLVALFNLVSTALILFAISIPGVLISLVVSLRRTSTLFSSIFGGILFHEKHLLKKWVATLGMILGVLLIVL